LAVKLGFLLTCEELSLSVGAKKGEAKGRLAFYGCLASLFPLRRLVNPAWPALRCRSFLQSVQVGPLPTYIAGMVGKLGLFVKIAKFAS
jgi:hypothetical protein